MAWVDPDYPELDEESSGAGDVLGAFGLFLVLMLFVVFLGAGFAVFFTYAGQHGGFNL